VAISCVTSLHLVVYMSLLYLYHLFAANSTKTIIINPSATQEDQICKLYDKIPQPENIKTLNVPSKSTWEHYSGIRANFLRQPVIKY
jgi:hypothetical protein